MNNLQGKEEISNGLDEAVVSQSSKPTNNKRRIIKWSILAIIVIGFVVWRIVAPKTVESGNGWKHQVGNFGQCEMYDCENNATQRYWAGWGVGGRYCDEHWESYGQDMFNRLAEKSNKGNSSSKATDAKICAEKAVKDQLKSPSTATFCKYTEMTATNLEGNKWKITGYVDAQNSYGATVRENWTVILTLTDSGFKDYTVTFD